MNAIKARGFAIAATAILVSCQPGPPPPSLEEIASRALPYTDTPEKEAVVRGLNDFAFGLYASLAPADQSNVFLSPFSISTALAMTHVGARGTTADQMEVALRFRLSQDQLPAAYGALLGDMHAAGGRDGYELDTANSLWGQSDFGFLPEFLSVLKADYGAPLQTVDFAGFPEPARVAINSWAALQTHNRILDLLPPGSVNGDTRLVLANAIYFKGTWARRFDTADTADGPFELLNGTTITVPMMSQEAELNYAENELVQLLELPYSTGDLSMLFLLPQRGRSFAELELALDADTVSLWCAELHPVEELGVRIPRFSFSDSFALAPELRAMGMIDAFTDKADFSGMSDSGGLSLGDVFHKAFVLVNEEGTEAAAATAVTVGVTAAGPSFEADRPFVFLLRHNLSGAILFLGRVTDPH